MKKLDVQKAPTATIVLTMGEVQKIYNALPHGDLEDEFEKLLDELDRD